MKCLRPTKDQRALSEGDRVFHEGDTYSKSLGFGKILREWGSWKACRTCYRPYCDKHRTKKEWYYEINGEGIFDVQFGNEVFSVNRVWLKPLRMEVTIEP